MRPKSCSLYRQNPLFSSGTSPDLSELIPSDSRWSQEIAIELLFFQKSEALAQKKASKSDLRAPKRYPYEKLSTGSRSHQSRHLPNLTIHFHHRISKKTDLREFQMLEIWISDPPQICGFRNKAFSGPENYAIRWGLKSLQTDNSLFFN